AQCCAGVTAFSTAAKDASGRSICWGEWGWRAGSAIALLSFGVVTHGSFRLGRETIGERKRFAPRSGDRRRTETLGERIRFCKIW
ncbi:MAG: hypothetical protein JSV36_15510, partial [Anaerolineae bacterium]